MSTGKSFWLRIKPMIFASCEVAIVIVMAAWLGRDFLRLDPMEVPLSPEFISSIQSHAFWSSLIACGNCSLWNASAEGGFPAFADYSGSGFHPIIGLFTALWGSIVGAKLAIVLSFVIAGVSQWWLGKELRVRGIFRIWGGIVVLVSGHLAGRMVNGAFPILFSTAMCSLVIPATLRLARSGESRDAVGLGILLASSLLSGGGYLQIGLIALLPGAVILSKRSQGFDQDLIVKFVYAALVGLMLAAPFLVPLFNFASNIEVLVVSDNGSPQPIEYLPLNFIIRDSIVDPEDVLGMIGESAAYIAYIGWTPILLAFIGIAFLLKTSERKAVAFFVVAILTSLYLASDLPWRGPLKALPINEAAFQTGYILGITVPLIIGLATVGANAILHAEIGLKSIALVQKAYTLRLHPLVLLLIPLLLVNIDQNFSTSRTFLTTRFQAREVEWTIEALKNEHLAWVATPGGESAFVTPAITSNLKLRSTMLPWRWSERFLPTPGLEASRAEISDAIAVYKSPDENGISIYRRPAIHYAEIDDGTGIASCEATGKGGHLVVRCNHGRLGTLIVQEHAIQGWRAARDGHPIPLQEGLWLKAAAISGEHEYVFEYSPWDFKVGLILFGFAIAIIIILLQDMRKISV